MPGEGEDTIESTANFHLLPGGENVENLVLLGAALNGTGDDDDNEITGNANNNILLGNGGDDVLDGAEGNDTLGGGLGSDILVGGDGIDTATFSLAGGNLIVDLDFGVAVNDANDDVDTLIRHRERHRRRLRRPCSSPAPWPTTSTAAAATTRCRMPAPTLVSASIS